LDFDKKNSKILYYHDLIPKNLKQKYFFKVH
jgi:hypothetical protein